MKRMNREEIMTISGSIKSKIIIHSNGINDFKSVKDHDGREADLDLRWQ